MLPIFSTLYLQHLATGTDLIGGARELVSALHEKYQLAIITNGLKDVQRAQLTQSAIGSYFAEIIISEEVGAVKPDPKIGSWPNGIKLGRTHDRFHGVSWMLGFSKHFLEVWVSTPPLCRR
jgi:hypothetical protein